MPSSCRVPLGAGVGLCFWEGGVTVWGRMEMPLEPPRVLCAVEFGRRCAPGLGERSTAQQAAFTAPTRTDSGQSQDLFRGGATVRPS